MCATHPAPGAQCYARIGWGSLRSYASEFDIIGEPQSAEPAQLRPGLRANKLPAFTRYCPRQQCTTQELSLLAEEADSEHRQAAIIHGC